MKYIRLFEQFEEGHKFDIFDLFTISPKEVKELFFRELERNPTDLENIQVFLDSGLVDVHTKDDTYDSNYYWMPTPLHWAARNNSLNLAKFLLSYGADVNVKAAADVTPLHRAAIHNSLAVAELLISSGADLEVKNDEGETPLHMATWRNSLEVAEFLISSGADLEAKDNEDKTPLHWAASEGSTEVTKFLVQSGANLHAIETRYGYKPSDSAESNNYHSLARYLREME